MVSALHLPHRTLTDFENNDRQWLHVLRDLLELEKRGRLLSGTTGPFDAIVDVNLSASDPANRNYRGIYEALTDLDAEGYVSAVIAVRPGIYTETAACTIGTTLQRVALVGFAHGTGVTGSAEDIIWRQVNNILTMSGDGRILRMSDIRMEPQSGTQTSLFSVGQLFMTRCEISGWSGGASQSVGCTFGFYHDCLFGGLMNWGSYVQMTNCEWQPSRSGGSAKTQTVAGSRIHATGLVVSLVNGLHTATLPAQATINGYMTTTIIQGSGASLGFKFAQTGGTLHLTWDSNNTFLTTVQLTSPKYYDIRGEIGSLTVQTTPVNGGKVDAIMEVLDVVGPAELDVAVSSGATVRGERVNGIVRQVGTRGAGVTFLTAVGLNRAILQLPTNNTGGHATAVPYNLDAASIDNIITFSGGPTWGAAGVDAGAGNRVMTEVVGT